MYVPHSLNPLTKLALLVTVPLLKSILLWLHSLLSAPLSGGPAHLDYITVCHIPVKRNPGCFDFVLIRRCIKNGKYDVYFLQFTVADHHDALLQYAAKFLQHMFPNNLAKHVETKAQEKKRTGREGLRSDIGEEASLLVHSREAPLAGPLASAQSTGADLTDHLAEMQLSLPTVSIEKFAKMNLQVHFTSCCPETT